MCDFHVFRFIVNVFFGYAFREFSHVLHGYFKINVSNDKKNSLLALRFLLDILFEMRKQKNGTQFYEYITRNAQQCSGQ